MNQPILVCSREFEGNFRVESNLKWWLYDFVWWIFPSQVHGLGLVSYTWRIIPFTLPETNRSPWKIDLRKRRFLLETTIFRGYMLVLGRVGYVGFPKQWWSFSSPKTWGPSFGPRTQMATEVWGLPGYLHRPLPHQRAHGGMVLAGFLSSILDGIYQERWFFFMG